ncbi:GNAT family N-acetyltransferase [Paludibacterium purpuratum]|uniref:Ribosomal protein S18 acetylase RimI-like enzyme n=1 Tax=Paludibacterium purpuratum TaxID=1144873 RepID=A0A4R7B6X8_9NEIS|nr:GNAT family N-acetyltransferase [Paludibacterium purpuratum]TDR80223.1 ribosomal protein S18 acetylase RimI-like enzyme [Paludibacterium purpuratum]
MPTPVIVRPASEHDWPVLELIFQLSRQAAFHWQSSADFIQGQLRAQSEGECIWVAEENDGRIVGFVSVWPANDFIHHLYTAPDRQGLGIGPALLRALPDWGQRRYTLKCLALNLPARRFYDRQGFQALELGDGEDGPYWLLAHPA